MTQQGEREAAELARGIENLERRAATLTAEATEAEKRRTELVARRDALLGEQLVD